MSDAEGNMRVTQIAPDKYHVGRWRGEECISRLYLIDRQMRIGCAWVRVGGISDVWTHPDHRSRGHNRAVMDHAVAFMAEVGFDVSMLHGIRRYYPRWGFATMMPECRVTIPTAAALGAPAGLNVRAYRRGEMPRLLAIHDELNALRTGTIARPPFPRDGFPKGAEWFTSVAILIAEDEGGEIVGYAAYDREKIDEHTGARTPVTDALRVAEIGAVDERAYGAMLRRLGEVARKQGHESFVAHLPPDDPFAVYCRSFGAECHTVTPSDGATMLRITSFGALLGKLEPELTRRVAGRGLSLTVNLVTDIGAAGLRLTNRGVRVGRALAQADVTLELEQWKLLQLLVGYRSLGDVLSDPRAQAFAPEAGARPQSLGGPGVPPGGQGFVDRRDACSTDGRDARSTVAALFPPQSAFWWHADRI